MNIQSNSYGYAEIPKMIMPQDYLEPVVYYVDNIDKSLKEHLLKTTPNSGSIPNYYLCKKSDTVKLPPKIYGKANRLLKHYFHRFDNTQESLEVMLVGDPGAGKTLLSDMICSECLKRGMPVIDISGIPLDESFPAFVKPLNNVCIRIDEFGKIFNYSNQKYLLTLMSDRNKRIFWVLTENSYNAINSLFVGATHRVRYSQEFSKIEKDVIDGYCTDMNVKPAFIEQLYHLQGKSSVFSFTHLRTLVDEHLMFPEQSLDQLLSVLNLKHLSTLYVVSIKRIELLGEVLCENPLELPASRYITTRIYSSRADTSGKGYNDFTPITGKNKSDRNLNERSNLVTTYDVIKSALTDDNGLEITITFSNYILGSPYQTQNLNGEFRKKRLSSPFEAKVESNDLPPPSFMEMNNLDPVTEETKERITALLNTSTHELQSLIGLKSQDPNKFKEVLKITKREGNDLVFSNEYFRVFLTISDSETNEEINLSYFS